MLYGVKRTRGEIVEYYIAVKDGIAHWTPKKADAARFGYRSIAENIIDNDFRAKGAEVVEFRGGSETDT